MTTRWGIKASTWPRVMPWGAGEMKARAWVKVLTCSNVSPPWTELYRDDGDGWVLVEHVVAERLGCPKVLDGQRGHRWSDGVCWNCGAISRLDVAVDHFGPDVESVAAEERVRLVRTRRPDLDAVPSDRFIAAGLPVPPPLTPEQEADLEHRQQETDAQPRVYGPKARP